MVHALEKEIAVSLGAFAMVARGEKVREAVTVVEAVQDGVFDAVGVPGVWQDAYMRALHSPIKNRPPTQQLQQTDADNGSMHSAQS